MMRFQENMKIITGLARAHKDCHDTRYELLELWINEIRYTYFEKLPSSEYEGMKEEVRKTCCQVLDERLS